MKKIAIKKCRSHKERRELCIEGFGASKEIVLWSVLMCNPSSGDKLGKG